MYITLQYIDEHTILPGYKGIVSCGPSKLKKETKITALYV